MATYTTRNDLIKPDYTDAADIDDLNDNFDFIDGSIAPCEWAKGVAPTANDDVTLGYIVGSLWFDTTAHKLYICEDNTDTAAVWRVLYNNGLPLVASGTQPLTADWDVGAYHITADHFVSDVADGGAAPFASTSKVVCTNLNADLLDGHEASAFLHADGTVNATNTITSTLADGTKPLDVTSKTVCTNLNADMVDGKDETAFALLAGRSGGQTLYGGTATTNNLVLYATSKDATGAIQIPNGGLEIGTKATTATYGAINIHEGAAGAANAITFLDGDGTTTRAKIQKTSLDNLTFYVGDGTTLDFTMGTNGVFTPTTGIYLNKTDWADPDTYTTGMTNVHTVTYSASAAKSFYSYNASVFPAIAKTYTNSGMIAGLVNQALRNNVGASTDDDGTLTELDGAYIQYGHYNTNASMNGTTTNAFGVRVISQCLKGTITNMYGINVTAPAAGGTITNKWVFYSDWDAQAYFTGQVYGVGNISALTFTDRTPGYEGDGIEDLKKIKNKDGKIDHDTLPAFARKKIEGKPILGPDGKPIGKEEEDGRDLGAMISILVKAVQQLADKVDDLTTRIEKLEKA